MKTLSFIVLMFFGSILKIQAQVAPFESNEIAPSSTITFLNTFEDYSYQFNLVSVDKTQFSCAISLRVEDELTSEQRYLLFKEASFFDVNLTYTFAAFDINMTIENLLGFNNKNFAIEPNLEQGVGSMENILFTHEADFLVSARIAYNFN